MALRSHYPDGDPVRWYRGKVEAVESGTEAALEHAMEDGAQMMRENIATRGTAKSGKAGRIESRAMYNDVTSEVAPRGKGSWEGKMGWIKNREDYYGYQEAGFVHFMSGNEVEGMYALQDAADWALKQFQEDVEKAVRDA